jgi:hypothetical protein
MPGTGTTKDENERGMTEGGSADGVWTHIMY